MLFNVTLLIFIFEEPIIIIENEGYTWRLFNKVCMYEHACGLSARRCIHVQRARAGVCACTGHCGHCGHSGPAGMCSVACAVRAARAAGAVSGVRARPLRGLNCRASVPLGRRAHARYRRLSSALPHCKIVYKIFTDYCKNTDIFQYVSSLVWVLD